MVEELLVLLQVSELLELLLLVFLIQEFAVALKLISGQLLGFE